ncbi:hypothetical protein [Acrocarpospora corrugata]|uniref:hypothetical protein n=1 Tax=Acrocarpospora corrugata TaxID=35763 RepID=UPI0014793788|nr:hypothetical protein [Acrocarpospora corrugata]
MGDLAAPAASPGRAQHLERAVGLADTSGPGESPRPQRLAAPAGQPPFIEVAAGPVEVQDDDHVGVPGSSLQHRDDRVDRGRGQLVLRPGRHVDE